MGRKGDEGLCSRSEEYVNAGLASTCCGLGHSETVGGAIGLEGGAIGGAIIGCFAGIFLGGSFGRDNDDRRPSTSWSVAGDGCTRGGDRVRGGTRIEERAGADGMGQPNEYNKNAYGSQNQPTS